MTQVRELRADVPVPDRARLVEGRQRLLDVSGRARRVRTVRGDRKLAVAGVAAAIMVVALLATQLVGSAGRTTEPATRTYPVGTVSEVLDRAADTIEKMPAPHPRDGQWIYSKRIDVNLTNEDTGPRERERWRPYADTAAENGEAGNDEFSAREIFRKLSRLPDDPEEVRKAAEAWYPKHEDTSPAEHAWTALTTLAHTYPIQPEGVAKAYRALKTVEGIDVVNHLVKDAAGRDAIALYRKDANATFRYETLIDPDTYTFTGFRAVAARDHTDEPMPDGEPGESWKKGEVVITEAVKDHALVEEDGQRP
ncbi:CU044_5270 family protein [Streptomyces sp. NPDC047108]|uniref:CU044_5270 family protein n=1 Tax=Streptomyces sp. NPDC047108 TaxID=3155025 RepID=UPI0034080EB7